VAAAGLSLLALAMSLLLRTSPEGSDDTGHLGTITPVGPYPEEWKTTLEEARSAVPFHLVVPATRPANEANLEATYVFPGGGAVELRFPPPAPASPPVRQEYLAVYLTVWGQGDPLADYREELARHPVLGQRVVWLDGVPALVVPPRSAADVERANPAYLEIVIDGLEVEISGGDDLDVLIDIARSMIAEAKG
jgi:hypothetical protein